MTPFFLNSTSHTMPEEIYAKIINELLLFPDIYPKLSARHIWH
ncbi:MAG: hypothetical protein OQK57_07145 [Ignavibacteriaceae bacterium]|nr:hypothetical protein [Ignavibacteriaceae bacterium]